MFGIIWLSGAALALVYLLAFAVYAAVNKIAVNGKAAAGTPAASLPLNDRAAVPARPERKLDSTVEITETVQLGKKEQNPTAECGSLRAGSKSLIGGRKQQEDSVRIEVLHSGMLMAVICDGMGGLSGGAEAAALAVRRLFEYVRDLTDADADNIPEMLKKAAYQADLDIVDMRSPEEGKAGTTAVAVLAKGNTVYWLSVGDSRIYLFRNRELKQITRDHNYELQLKYAVEAGEITASEATRAERPDALISYLGMDGVTLADTGKIDLQPQDAVLLCSDGLFKSLPDTETAQIIENFGANVAGCAEALAAAAVNRGGPKQDNTTVAIIRPVSQ